MTLTVCEKYAFDAERVNKRFGLSQGSRIRGPSHGLRPLHHPSTEPSRIVASESGRRWLPFFSSRT